ncbi:MAG: hypothetical protein OXI61_12350 [Candidatus Poribacteria bacterium]|nr:hypothetical protein [Candidatus Poribacteria bacterium]
MQKNKEDLITTAFVKILRPMRHKWDLTQHPSRPFMENDKEPDILVTETESDRDSIAIEDKVDKEGSADHSGERQLKDDYLGKTLRRDGRIIHTGIAVRFPYRFREIEQSELDEKMEKADDIAYCLISTEKPNRFPKEGWLTGCVADIATAIRVRATPISKIEEAVQTLKDGVNHAAIRAEQTIEEHPDIGEKIANILVQAHSKQTIQMAMLIIGNAFIFQSILAHKPDMKKVLSLNEITPKYGKLSASEVLESWEHIQDINYKPIFGVAERLVRALCGDDLLVGDVLRILRKTALNLRNMGLAQEHELAGIAFQEFIEDRKIIKANYTLRESSSLLCGLILPELKQDAKNIKVGDFACGTGTLLNGIYQRILALSEQTGGKGEDIHKHMMEKNLIGCDILPNATHLTVSIVAGTYPNIQIGDTRIKTMRYGTQHGDGRYAIGALDLISNPEVSPLDLEKAETVGGHGNYSVAVRQHFKHGECDIVIQNPPFTKNSADNNSRAPKGIFGDHENKAEMRKSLKIHKSEIGNDRAGLGSYFIDIADKMLKTDGSMGFILPSTILSASTWNKARNLWAREYHDMLVVSIAAEKTEECAFSADTDMTECLILGKKGRGKNTGRGTFVCLHRRPTSELEALEIAKEISKLNNVSKLEDGLTGGNPIKVGSELVGYAQDCPLLPSNGVWSVFCVKDLTVVESAYQIVNGHLQLPQQQIRESIPICQLSEIAKVGSRIYDTKGEDGKNAFEFVKGCPNTADYPCLRYVNRETQRAIVVQPDVHALPRPNAGKAIEKIKNLKSRVHYNMFLRFNTNSLAAMFTEQNATGANLIPSIIFEDKSYEYVWTLWCNSTLGLLCHWVNASKQHTGRGIYARVDLRSLPTLDVSKLNAFQLMVAQTIFQKLKNKRMLPFNEMENDPVRQELDQLLLSEVLGLEEKTHPEVHRGIAHLRAKLCAEPSIHGGTDSKCDLDAEARKLQLQSESLDTEQVELSLP